MKKIIFLFSIAFFIISCSENDENENQQNDTNDNGQNTNYNLPSYSLSNSSLWLDIYEIVNNNQPVFNSYGDFMNYDVSQGIADFNQDLSSWNVSNVTQCSSFSYKTPRWTLPKPNFTNCNPN